MTDQVKSDYWLMEVTAVSYIKVVFDESLTQEDAENAFNDGDYSDITDEEIIHYEDCAAVKALNDE